MAAAISQLGQNVQHYIEDLTPQALGIALAVSTLAGGIFAMISQPMYAVIAPALLAPVLIGGLAWANSPNNLVALKTALVSEIALNILCGIGLALNTLPLTTFSAVCLGMNTTLVLAGSIAFYFFGDRLK